MHLQFLVTFAPLFALLVKAQTLSNGRLIIYTPNDMIACQAANIQWAWTGSQYDLNDNTIQIAVEQESSNHRRALAKDSPVRFLRKRSQKWHARDVAINIAGGSNIPMSQLEWTWSSVGVPEGIYRMALTIEGQGYTGYSEVFSVTQGQDLSCLGGNGLGVATTTVGAEQTTTAPAQVIPTSTTNTANHTTQDNATASANSPSLSAHTASATAPTFSAQSESSKQGKKGQSGGGIAAAVLLPLLAGILLYFFCLKRNKANGQSSDTSKDWSEKFTGLFGGVGSHSNEKHRRQISTPMDPVHVAGMAMHDQSVKSQMRQANNDPCAVTQTPEHWVNFHPDVQESDAHLVSPHRVEEMVRASMEMSNQQRPFYQQGSNEALRQSTSTRNRRSTIMTESDGNSTLPSYLRDADFTSQRTHSSFGHDVNGASIGYHDEAAAAALERSTTQRSHTLERSESKIRRKPVPTYSTISDSQVAGDASPAMSDDTSPFSDVHGIIMPPNEVIAKGGESSGSLASDGTIHNGILQEILPANQEFIADSPTLAPSPAILMHTPISNSREFPVSVYGSPANRVLLDTPRGSVADEDKKEVYKLSITMPTEDRGFRVSF